MAKSYNSWQQQNFATLTFGENMKQRLYNRTTVLLSIFLSFLMMSMSTFAAEEMLQVDISEVVSLAGVSPKNSALIITCLEDGRRWTSGDKRLKFIYPPASTAKIPHTLIALEEGYAEGPETIFEWDGKERFLEVWNQDQTLHSAYCHSVVWVYQKITRDLGYEVMSSWIDRFQYGNRFIGSLEDITTYWLDGPLMTSVEHQIAFLSDLAKENLPLSIKTFRNGKLIMREALGEDWILYARTGFSSSVGWYVGWVETNFDDNKRTYVFAFNMDIENWDQLPKRKEVVRQVLHRIGVLFRNSG